MTALIVIIFIVIVFIGTNESKVHFARRHTEELGFLDFQDLVFFKLVGHGYKAFIEFWITLDLLYLVTGKMNL